MNILLNIRLKYVQVVRMNDRLFRWLLCYACPVRELAGPFAPCGRLEKYPTVAAHVRYFTSVQNTVESTTRRDFLLIET